MQPRQVLPAYQQECGSCHLAYPAGLLPASSWHRIMDGLDQHYGSDASLDAQTTRQIGAWLQAHAATRRRTSQAPPQDRITRSSLVRTQAPQDRPDGVATRQRQERGQLRGLPCRCGPG